MFENKYFLEKHNLHRTFGEIRGPRDGSVSKCLLHRDEDLSLEPKHPYAELCVVAQLSG